MPANYYAPPVDATLVLSNNQTVTSDAASTNYYDAKGPNCFPKRAKLFIKLAGIATGESVAIKVQQDDNSSFSSPTDLLTLGTYTSDPADILVFDLSNDLITEQYSRLYYDTSTGDSIPITAWLSVG